MIRIAVLPGDGVGWEVLEGPVRLAHELAARGIIDVTGPLPVGASSYGSTGEGLPASTLAACEDADAILLGAIGEHPGVPLSEHRPELALLALREHFDLRVSIRQVWQPGRPPITFVRNLLAGAYGGTDLRGESTGETPAWDRFELEPWRIAELAEIALGYLQRAGHNARFISVDKANLLATSRLWRRVVGEAASAANVDVRHVYVDRFAYELGCTDVGDAVVVTEGLFGDILSDLASGRAGSIAMCASASIHPGHPVSGRCVGLFEPVHGSAPMRAGQNKVNPTGGFLSLAALLDWFPETAVHSEAIRRALAAVIEQGVVTYDLDRPGRTVVGTDEFSDGVVKSFLEMTA